MTFKSLRLWWCNIRIKQNFVFFSVVGWKSNGLKYKGHFKSKGLKAFKGTKAKSYIHKGLGKRSAKPWGHSLKGDSSKGFCWKGHSLKGKCRSHVGLT